MSQFQPVNTSWCLEQLCESNYLKLLRLIPDLADFEQMAVGTTLQHPALYVEIIERSPYTLTLELSHRFQQTGADASAKPSVKIRVYWDVRLAEVLRDYERQAVDRVYPNPGRVLEIQEYKWRLNYFLQKWLDYCLKSQYRFRHCEAC
jgi:uncharacterized protein